MSEKIPGRQYIEILIAICADVGIKLTHQRLEIFKEMLAAKDHPSAEFIHKRLPKTISTIALDFHYYFVCTRCKKIQDLYWPEFDSITPPESTKLMGQITSLHLEIRGINNDCS